MNSATPMTHVRLTLCLDLETPTIPSPEALFAAAQRAESAAARVFVNGDLGGEMHVKVEPSSNAVPKTCEVAHVLPTNINATVLKLKKTARKR